MAGRRITWRRFIPAGALTAAFATAYGAISTVYMPRQLASDRERYGLFGVTLALIGWLSGIALIIVAATARGRDVGPRRGSLGAGDPSRHRRRAGRGSGRFGRGDAPHRAGPMATILRSTASGTSPQQ